MGDLFNPTLASGRQPYRVALVGEAPGESEAEQGRPFCGKAGFKLTRLIEWAGLERDLRGDPELFARLKEKAESAAALVKEGAVK